MRFAVFTMILTSILSAGCDNSGSEKLSTDLVSNPNSAYQNSPKSSLPVAEFEKLSHDFGKITAGEKVTFSFKFRNTGGSDLIISDATAACGCTVPEYTKAPIQPGKDGIISVTFNSEGRSGVQRKSITVITNAQPNTVVLTITADVMEL